MSAPDADWTLSDGSRADTVARLAANMTALAFSRGAALDDAAAFAAAAAAERKAYTTARVEARTTTGTRPATETAAAYTRKLAELALEVVKGQRRPTALLRLPPRPHPRRTTTTWTCTETGSSWWRSRRRSTSRTCWPRGRRTAR